MSDSPVNAQSGSGPASATPPSAAASGRPDLEDPAPGWSALAAALAGDETGRRRLMNRLRDWVWAERRTRARGPARWAWRAAQIAWAAFEDFGRHQCGLRAATLTYTAFLSFVPILAIVFAILKFLKYPEMFANRLLESLTAGSPETVDSIRRFVAETLHYVDQTEVTGLTSFAVAGLLVTTISVFRNIEHTMNIIWGAGGARPIARMVSDYISLIVVAPVLLAAGTYAATLARVPSQVPFSGAMNEVAVNTLLPVLPYVTVWAGFTFLFFYMPNTRVYWLSALIGGLTAGTIWLVAQVGYIHLTIQFYAQRYNLIYGAFAWVLILLIWVYISWMIFLFGAEIGHAHQTLDEQRRERRRWRGTLADGETLALRLAALLARPALAPAGSPFAPMRLEELADALLAPPKPVRRVLELFVRAGVAYRTPGEGGFLLCRPPQTLNMLDLLRLVRHGTLEEGAPGEAPRPGGPFAGVNRQLAEVLSGITLADIAAMPPEEIRTLRI